MVAAVKLPGLSVTGTPLSPAAAGGGGGGGAPPPPLPFSFVWDHAAVASKQHLLSVLHPQEPRLHKHPSLGGGRGSPQGTVDQLAHGHAATYMVFYLVH